MKRIILLLLLTGLTLKAQTTPPDSVATQVKFLENHDQSSKDYIIGLFDRYDIVIFCERTHDELTQYELLVDIMADKRFRTQVGDVFMEMGGSNFDSKINDYLFTEGLSKEENMERALQIQRNMAWYPIWERYNYHYLLTSLYNINKSLAKEQKIQLHPTDLAIDWNTITTVEEVKGKILSRAVQGGRDSVMGHNIIAYIGKHDGSSAKRKKYFVILNSAHATKGTWTLGPYKVKSATSYIFDKYPKRTANVLINFQSLLTMSSTTEQLPETSPILNGKLDAAFEFLGINDRGFDIKGSPLEKHRFENMSMEDSILTNEEVFTGYVFYKSFPKHEHVNGIPGIIDIHFKSELLRRYKLWDQATNYNSTEEENEQYLMEVNTLRIKNPEGLQSYWQQVMYWIDGGKQIADFYSESKSILGSVAFIRDEKKKEVNRNTT